MQLALKLDRLNVFTVPLRRFLNITNTTCVYKELFNLFLIVSHNIADTVQKNAIKTYAFDFSVYSMAVLFRVFFIPV